MRPITEGNYSYGLLPAALTRDLISSYEDACTRSANRRRLADRQCRSPLAAIGETGADCIDTHSRCCCTPRRRVACRTHAGSLAR
jgi:hypothetical protein